MRFSRNYGYRYGGRYFCMAAALLASFAFGGCAVQDVREAASGTDISAAQEASQSVPAVSESIQSSAEPSPEPTPVEAPSPSPSAEAPSPSPSPAVSQGETKDIESVFAQLGDQVTASVGEIALPAFVIDFPDVKYAGKPVSAEEMRERTFGEGNGAANYFDISSGGRLKMDGDVYLYTAKKNIGEYETYKGVEQLVAEALDFYDAEVDFSKYDKNGDGVMDALMLTVPTTGSNPDFWWGVTATWGDCGEDTELHDYEVDGVRLCRYIINDIQPLNLGSWIATLEHEMGHCMGLPDYYKYNSSDSQGLSGSAGIEMMDDSKGDFCQFSKLQLGWLREDQVQVMPAGVQEASFLLSPSEEGGCVLVFPEGQEPDYQSEYFLIEYNTPVGLYKGLIGKGGVRILHVQAELRSGRSDAVNLYRYGNFSPEYDQSDKGIRVLKLVGKYYHEGDVVEYGAGNFGWYDKVDGKKIVDPGFQVAIGAEKEDGVEIRIQRTGE